MREFRHPNESRIVQLLEQLTRSPAITPPAEYREFMRLLGREYVRLFSERWAGLGRLLLVCTNEDADFLARGILEELSLVPNLEIALACFWNERSPEVDLAPVVRRYVEPCVPDAFLVVKSIIASACVVRTNIEELISEHRPATIFVFAPVILKGAEERLRSEFEASISDRFVIDWFAQDDEREGENVRPGIGGQVYERLGLGTAGTKNRHTPGLVRERRERFLPATG